MAQIAAHQTRDDKLPTITHAEMQQKHNHLESALTYALEKNLEPRCGRRARTYA